jgi:outer membrane lipoprotein LolB
MRPLGSLRALSALVIVSLLAACAILPGGRDNTLPRSAEFDMLGRVLVVYGGKAFTSNMRWLHAPERDELWLLTPTGQALAHIVDSPRGATLTATDQTEYHSASVESLTRQALGWELPLARLQHWVRGTPMPGLATENIERDDSGRLIKLTQDGWRVDYLYYPAPEQDGQPRRLEISSGDNKIRLVIDSWRREPAAP